MHISQPALTRNMQKFETAFEVPLFHRTKNSITLNETGILAAEDAAILLKQTENMFRHAHDFDRTGRTIRLGSCTPAYMQNSYAVSRPSTQWGEEHLSFLLPKRHRFARRKSLSVSEMNGENMLLFQDIGFWHDLVVEKMPESPRSCISSLNFIFP